MEKAIEIYEKYLENPSIIASMSDFELVSFIKESWNELGNEWFISYFEQENLILRK